MGVAGMSFGADVHLPALAKIDGIIITGLADSGSGRARTAAARHAPEAQVFDNGLDLVRWSGIDAVSIAVPPRQQAAVVRAAIDAGKHIICEKPFCAGLDEIEGFAADAVDKGLTTAVGYEFRYDKAFETLCKAVWGGSIGQVQQISVTWLTGGGLDIKRLWSWRHDVGACGGVLVDWCSHLFDYSLLIAGSDVSEILAHTSITVRQRPDGQGGAVDVTAPDSCDIQCAFYNGVVGRYTVSNVQAAGTGHKIEVSGDKGRIVFHHAPPFTSHSKTLTLYTQGGDVASVPIMVADDIDGEDDRTAAYRDLAIDFFAVAQGAAASCRFPDFATGEKVWRVLEAARKSSDQGVTVRVEAA